jgi:ribonuclease VapC
MILASSPVVAILLREPGHGPLLAKMAEAETIGIGAPTLTEAAGAMIERIGEGGRGLVSQFLESLEVEVTPFGVHHFQIATEAELRFGRGRHPAGLRLAECMTYATARLAGQPLLFTGEGFARTDIEAA